MDIGKAFTYVFDDARWVTKLAMLALFFLLEFILVGIPFVLGYQLQIIRNVHRGEPVPLPEWSDLGVKFTDGIKLFVVGLIYALPMIILYCCNIGLSVGVAAGSSSSSDAGGALAAIVTIGSLLISCLYFLYAIVILVLAPAIVIQYARTSDIAASLRLGEIMAMVRALPGPYIITVLMIGLALPFIGGLGFVICIGIFFTYPYIYMVGGHLYGQLWRQLDSAPQAFK